MAGRAILLALLGLLPASALPATRAADGAAVAELSVERRTDGTR